MGRERVQGEEEEERKENGWMVVGVGGWNRGRTEENIECVGD